LLARHLLSGLLLLIHPQRISRSGVIGDLNLGRELFPAIRALHRMAAAGRILNPIRRMKWVAP
jgi:hypothetical protein